MSTQFVCRKKTSESWPFVLEHKLGSLSVCWTRFDEIVITIHNSMKSLAGRDTPSVNTIIYCKLYRDEQFF